MALRFPISKPVPSNDDPSRVRIQELNANFVDRIKFGQLQIFSSLYIYHFSTVIDFSSEKYSGSTGHRNSWYQ